MANGSDSAFEVLVNEAPSEESFLTEEAQSFDAFFKTHQGALAGYLRRRTASEEDAQEIVQESYARILSYGYGSSRPPGVWKSLLYRIASNLAVSRLRMDRAHHVAGRQSIDEVDLVCEAPSHEHRITAGQELALIRAAIAELSPKCRKVFLLSRSVGKTYPEIAALCGISVKMVEKYISQALAALRGKLGDRG